MKSKNILLIALVFVFSSCDVLLNIADDVVSGSEGGTTSNPLTQAEVVNGLKEALKVGTDTAVSIVSKKDGYFKNELLKIGLPPEARIIIENKDKPILQKLGVSAKIDELILAINRSAESAAVKAKPIFIDAVKNMSISDAFGILKGSDTAATAYFRKSTYQSLYNAFHPVMKSTLDKPMVGQYSASESWENLTTIYNNAARFSTELTPVNTELDKFVTNKAIDGLFIKIAEEEQSIRKDPMARVTSILERVFGYYNN
jgi:hypothetical protein